VITLETGVPGSGKTLYCVDKLLRALVGSKVKHKDSDGNVVEIPRTIYTNVNGLLLEHEKIGPGGEWTCDGKTKEWKQVEGSNRLGLHNWYEWAKPGAVIVYDEVQKPWPLAAAGSPVPPCIQALETHRHMGVDFIVLTQHPMLIHANLVRLVGRHLHIRRMGNMGLAIVYEWDTCSRTLLYKNAFSKGAYRYDKKVFQLYKSAELHTKQPRRIPSLLYGVLIAALGIAYFAPSSYSRISERINPKPPVKVAEPAKAQSVAAAQPGPVAVAPSVPASGATQTLPGGLSGPLRPVETFAGCGHFAGKCKCFDSKGVVVPRPLDICEAALPGGSSRPIQLAVLDYGPVRVLQEGYDADLRDRLLAAAEPPQAAASIASLPLISKAGVKR
jgi:zona occludens toxin